MNSCNTSIAYYSYNETWMLENTVTLYIRVSKCMTTKNACAHVSTRQPWLHIMLSYTLDLSPCSVTPPQDHVDVGTSTRQSHLHGVAFPIDQDALHALQQLWNKELAYVRLVSFFPPLPLPLSLSLSLSFSLSLFPPSLSSCTHTCIMCT